MIARFAQPDDFHLTERFFSEYQAEGNDGDLSLIKNHVQHIIGVQSAIVVELDEAGTVIGTMAGHFLNPFSEKRRVFFVMFFFISKDFRKNIRKFIQVCTNLLRGRADSIVIASPFSEYSEKRDRFYRLMGFKPVETHFMKAI